MNEIPTWEQFIRFVLQGLSNGTTLRVHELKERVINIAKESYRGAPFYVRNVPSRISPIVGRQLTLLKIKHSSNIEDQKALEIVQVGKGYIV